MKRLAALLIASTIVLITACADSDSKSQVRHFCTTLAEVNSGSIDTTGLSELQGHAFILKTLLAAAPPSLAGDLEHIHEAIDAWARSISGEQPMLDTFALLSAAGLVGSEGRVTDFIAGHCELDLGGAQWVEAEAPNAEDLCPAWPRIGTPLTFNHFPNLPDIAGSNYFAQNFLISRVAAFLGVKSLKGAFVVEPGGKAVFRGQYPHARYFAYHPNDMDLNNLRTLRDSDLEPDPGSENPFLLPVTDGNANYYTATLSFEPTPANPQANTSYVGMRKDGTSKNQFVVNLLRMYHLDTGNGAGSGDVPLPSLSIYDAAGNLEQHFPECDPFAPGRQQLKTERVFPALPIIDHRSRNPPRWTNSSNFDAPSDSMANADAQYLATHYSQLYGNIFVIRARFLTAPDTRNGEPVATPGKQVRLYNLCTYNFWNGSANACMLENELLRDEDGFYTLVVSSVQNKPDNLAATHASWLDWGPYLDGQLQYRFVYRENPYIQAIAAAAEGKPIADKLREYVPAAVPCDRSSYETGGWQTCFDKQKQ
jgi:hypothetical protein